MNAEERGRLMAFLMPSDGWNPDGASEWLESRTDAELVDLVNRSEAALELERSTLPTP